MPEALVTSSWDDGAPEDLRLAELLAKYAVPGCFYVPRSNPERAVLPAQEIRRLASAFEIGGHTLRHLLLTRLQSAEARAEIHDCRRWLEDVTGVAPRSFCYPAGKFRAQHVREVVQAGFAGARTADWMCLALGSDAYRIAPSLHLYPHRRLIHAAHCVRHGKPRELARYALRFGAAVRPARLARAMLEHVAQHGGVFHVWGHSWEIAQRGLWDELEQILRAIAEQPGLTRVDNAALALRIKRAA